MSLLEQLVGKQMTILDDVGEGMSLRTIVKAQQAHHPTLVLLWFEGREGHVVLTYKHAVEIANGVTE